MQNMLKIGTRQSELAVWQATLVKEMLAKNNIQSELVFIQSEGDIDLITPLYAMGVQGVFSKALDAALLNNRIDIAVHSMKDVPVQLAQGLSQAAVLKRASCKDLLVYKKNQQKSSDQFFTSDDLISGFHGPSIIATSSIRRKAQWLHRYPDAVIENLRGNVNTRLKKLSESNWNGAIFAAAGLERIHLRPANSIELDWMLPAPAQGAILVLCRDADKATKNICSALNDLNTEICVTEERRFLKALTGGCSTPISAYAVINDGSIIFKGNIFSPDGKDKLEIENSTALSSERFTDLNSIGIKAANELLKKGADKILEGFKNAE